MFKKLDKMLFRCSQIEKKLQDSSAIKNSEDVAKLLKEHANLSKIVSVYKEYQKAEENCKFYESVIKSGREDKEFLSLARQELKSLKPALENFKKKLKQFMAPKDPMDEKSAIMEIRSAAGGSESALFTEELFMMYSHYIASQNWKMEILSSAKSAGGGFKEIIFSVSGEDVYGCLKYESGVHRVQRVPKTESQGRIHTSTATVATLPSVDEMTIKIDPKDIRIDTFKSSGAGGQHVNTTDSAVRVTHIPTQTVVQCQDEKSQHANKEKAMKVLLARLYDLEMQKKKQAESQERLSQIGTGDRSEKIRTYNFPQSRVTDHRISFTVQSLDLIMKGDLNILIEPLKAKALEQTLKAEEI